VIYLGIVVVPSGCLALALAVTMPGRVLSSRVIGLMAIEPAIVVTAVLTNPWHHLFFAHARLVGVHPIVLLWQREPLFWANLVYSYVLLGVGMAVLVRGWLATSGPFRRQITSMIVAASVPWAANVATSLGVSPLGSLDLTPIAFSVSGVVFAWAMFRQRLFDLAPIARGVLIDTMTDAVMVIDLYGRIVDLNRAGDRLLRAADPTLAGHLIGEPAAWALASWPDGLLLPDDQAKQISVQPVSGAVELDVRLTSLEDRRGRATGLLVVMRDVTDNHQVQRGLAEANTALRHQVETIEELRAELQEQATRDPLTGLFNRRYLDETLAREMARADRESYPISLALIDVDHFKNVNDTFGHPAGDAMLNAIGRFLTSEVRAGDVCCRYGGEEFVVIMPNATLLAAEARAEKWRAGCSRLRVPGSTGEAQITISVGVATSHDDDLDAASILAAADGALYAAKRSGRDRVSVADPVFDAALMRPARARSS
jgi:diguanylate cyclase (GGDEF)-like protein